MTPRDTSSVSPYRTIGGMYPSPSNLPKPPSFVVTRAEFEAILRRVEALEKATAFAAFKEAGG